MFTNRRLIYLGFVIPLLFWSTTILCGLLTEQYNPFVNMVSELGASGTKTQTLFTVGLALSSIFSTLFVIGLYRTAKNAGLNTLPVLLILTFSFSILGAALFSLPSHWHGILGSPSMLLPLSPLFALILWDKEIIPNIKIASGIILLLMLSGFLTMTPFMDYYFGLKQRFFHMAWSIWFVYLSLRFLRLNLKTDRKQVSKLSD